MNQADTPVIELKNVHKRFEQRPDLAQRILALAGRPIDRRTVYAVNGVDLSIRRGEVVGLVGESGCGKSTLGRVVAGLHRQTEGELLYQGRDAARLRGADKLAYTLGVQMIFQDPQASLNPRQRLRQILGEALKVHKLAPPADIPARIDQALSEVGLDREYRDRFPHQISGGQRQRIGIARALMVAPKFLVCDEPVAALDVSIQAQVINLFMDLREQHGFTYLFISHDLGVVKHISDRVAIMYLGKIVEISTAAEIFARQPPLYPGPDGRGAGRGAARPQVHAHQGRNPVAAESAAGLYIQPALSARHAALPRAGAGPEGNLAGPLVGLPSERSHRLTRRHETCRTHQRRPHRH